MSTSLLDAPPTYRYKDVIELLRERGIWAKIKRLLIVRGAIDKALKDSRPYLELLEKDIHRVEDISQLKHIRSDLCTFIEELHCILELCEKTIAVKVFLKSLLPELRQTCERLEDLLENVELALSPTFKRSVEQALGELPPDVSSRAKEELNDWLHHS